jgi:hypothetical protein
MVGSVLHQVVEDAVEVLVQFFGQFDAGHV